MNQSDKVDQLFSALVKVQMDLRGAKKDSSNPFFKSSYADLESCWNAAREALVKNGLCVIQTTETVNPHDDNTALVTTLGHVSGQWIRGFLPLNMKAKDPQGQGSAITYARRYAFAAIIGLVQVDDDAEGAMERRPASNPHAASNMQPGPNDGHTPDQGYMIDFGKWNRRSLEQVMRDQGPDEIRGYIDYLENAAVKQNKPIERGGRVAVFIEQASNMLAAFENGTSN